MSGGELPPLNLSSSTSATSTPLPSSLCTDLHRDAYGNQTLKPGVCYAAPGGNPWFTDARAYCRAMGPGWDLADIEDQTEQRVIRDFITALRAAGR